MSKKILSEFENQSELYKKFTTKISSLIREILSENNVNFHSVTSRTKDRQSLERKLLKRGSEYESIVDVTDITGIRITTYFEDDVHKVTQILNDEFEIDEANSIDKRTLLDPDRFGYLSTHHVGKLSAARCAFLEYQRYADLKFEVQTRSILQHAWAEIEHDLGYKSILEVPKEIRRRFSRLSSLLELADSEFIAIREQLHSYNLTVPDEIRKRADRVDINKNTLLAFTASDETIGALDQRVTELSGGELNDDEHFIERMLDTLDFFNIKTVAQLRDSLVGNYKIIPKFAEAMILRYPPADGKVKLSRGASILFMGYILAASENDPKVMSAYLEKIKVTGKDLSSGIRTLYANVVFS